MESFGVPRVDAFCAKEGGKLPGECGNAQSIGGLEGGSGRRGERRKRRGVAFVGHGIGPWRGSVRDGVSMTAAAADARAALSAMVASCRRSGRAHGGGRRSGASASGYLELAEGFAFGNELRELIRHSAEKLVQGFSAVLNRLHGRFPDGGHVGLGRDLRQCFDESAPRGGRADGLLCAFDVAALEEGFDDGGPGGGGADAVLVVQDFLRLGLAT